MLGVGIIQYSDSVAVKHKNLSRYDAATFIFVAVLAYIASSLFPSALLLFGVYAYACGVFVLVSNIADIKNHSGLLSDAFGGKKITVTSFPLVTFVSFMTAAIGVMMAFIAHAFAYGAILAALPNVDVAWLSAVLQVAFGLTYTAAMVVWLLMSNPNVWRLYWSSVKQADDKEDQYDVKVTLKRSYEIWCAVACYVLFVAGYWYLVFDTVTAGLLG